MTDRIVEDQPDRTAVEAALDRAGDDDALLAGEEEAPAQADPRPWIAAYSELVRYKEALLVASSDQTAGMREETARVEAESVDEVIIRNQLARYRRRLDYWSKRGANGAHPSG